MSNIEALRLALEALKNSQYRFAEYGYQAMQKTIDGNKEAITAIKAALEAKDEPVACVIDGDLYFPHEIDWEDLAYQGHEVELLYTTPPQRTWVGLTEQEQGAIMEDLNAHGTRLYLFARAIEAAHGIKGEA